MIQNSLNVRSICKIFWFFIDKPKITLYQHLLNPKIPKKFEEKIIIIDKNGIVSNKPV